MPLTAVAVTATPIETTFDTTSVEPPYPKRLIIQRDVS